jgi:hypothetical protein
MIDLTSKSFLASATTFQVVTSEELCKNYQNVLIITLLMDSPPLNNVVSKRYKSLFLIKVDMCR